MYSGETDAIGPCLGLVIPALVVLVLLSLTLVGPAQKHMDEEAKDPDGCLWPFWLLVKILALLVVAFAVLGTLGISYSIETGTPLVFK